MPRFLGIQDLVEELQKEGLGALTLTMEELKEACGVQRLRPQIIERMKEKLMNAGLMVLPPELSLNRWEEVRVYKRDSPVGMLIVFALEPSKDHDQELRSLARVRRKNTQIVEKARDLLTAIEEGDDEDE